MSIRSRIAQLLLWGLDPAERAVVEGDLRELRLPQDRAIRELVGLVMRRQIAAWLAWRPWVAIVIVLSLGMMLSLISRYWAHTTAIYAWLYVENWTAEYLASPGARSDLLQFITARTLESVALIGWAWTIGSLVGSLSRRTAFVVYVVFAAVVFFGTVGSTTIAVRNPANAVVFSQPFYRDGLPLAFRIAFILVPAFHGVWRAIRRPALTSVPSAILAITVVTATALVARGPQGAVTFGWWSLSSDGPSVSAVLRLTGTWRFLLMPAAMALPAAYVFFRAVSHTWPRRPRAV